MVCAVTGLLFAIYSCGIMSAASGSSRAVVLIVLVLCFFVLDLWMLCCCDGCVVCICLVVGCFGGWAMGLLDLFVV